MVTEDMIRIIRENVRLAREKSRESWIQGRINWSRERSQENWLSRLVFRSPNREYTREEAIASFGDVLNEVNWKGHKALEICDAIQTANANGLPLRLTVAEVAELRKWL